MHSLQLIQKFQEQVKRLLGEGFLLKDQLELSPLEMEERYAAAYTLYMQQQYAQAETAFQALLLLDPRSYDCWMGLAASRQMLEKFPAAIEAYMAAALLNARDPAPFEQASLCHQKLGQTDQANYATQLATLRKTYYPLPRV